MVEKMSGDSGQGTRASNALMRRAESIKKWKGSDTAKEKAFRLPNQFTIQFDQGTVFLSAVASGDIEETAKLLDDGVDIDYTNVDGLTALHQACIDENEEMVNLLLERGANIEARDNEGWTPLHAAVSAGNVDIAQILIDNNADLAAVNNEGEVPLDLAEEEEMEEYITEEIENRAVEVEDARNEEENMMVEDATAWLKQKKVDEVLDWQGATALHVAASKGYNKVINLLLQIPSVDVNVRDNDGWTPLHAAVHWGSKSTCELLTDAGADFELRNANGQTPCDVAEPEFIKTAEACRKRSKELSKKTAFTKNKKLEDENGGKTAFHKDFNFEEMLKKNPPRSAVKGGREQSKNGTLAPNSTSNNISGKDSDSESEKDLEVGKRPAPTQNASTVSSRRSHATTSSAETPPSRTSLPNNTSHASNPSSKSEEPKDIKPEPVLNSSRLNSSRLRKEPEKEEPKKDDSRSRFSALRSTPVSKWSGTTEEEKEEPKSTGRFQSSRLPSTNADTDDSTTPSWRRSKRTDDNSVSTSSTANDENESSEPDVKRNSRTSEDTADSRRSRTSTEDESNSRMSIAERLRRKNQELLSSTDRGSDRTTFSERTYGTDRFSSSRDRDTSSTSSVRDRNIGRSSATGSSDTNDVKELQRRLEQKDRELQEYKQKYEKMKKEKEELQSKLEQFQEDVEKMQELKNDNLRLKDENGALIRVISKLSRTPTSSS